MRINVHDFSGHPFQVELSRELAARGHEVTHTYCSDYVTGRGLLEVQPSDPSTLTITPLSAGRLFHKYRPAARVHFELAYARAWQQFLSVRRFDVALCCNLPLLGQAWAQRYLRRHDQPWVFWHQDIYSEGMKTEIGLRLPRLARPLGRFVEHLEKVQVRQADRVVAISDSFVDQYRRWDVDTSHVSVIPNWATLDSVRPGPRDNAWSRANALPSDGVRLLYSGTLGRKHNPMLLVRLLDEIQRRGITATLTVCSQGAGANDLIAAVGDRPDIRILPFQPAEVFDEVLASADILIALLEPAASRFSVPSKVLTYLAAGRPVIGLMPVTNPAAADILASGGSVSTPDVAGVQAAAGWVHDVTNDPARLADIGKASRTLAERLFDIAAIADRFETVLAVSPHGQARNGAGTSDRQAQSTNGASAAER